MIRRYGKWAVRDLRYVYYDGTPCKQFDLRGPIEGFLADDSEVIQAADLDDGWVRYWTISTNPEWQQTIVDLVAAYRDAE